MKQIFTLLFLSFFVTKMNAQPGCPTMIASATGPVAGIYTVTGTICTPAGSYFSGGNFVPGYALFTEYTFPASATNLTATYSTAPFDTYTNDGMGNTTYISSITPIIYASGNQLNNYFIDPITLGPVGPGLDLVSDVFGLPIPNYPTSICFNFSYETTTSPYITTLSVTENYHCPGSPATAFIGAPLSVKLTTFTVNQQNNTNIIAWQTASEQNAQSFEVQKSTDAQNFTTIGSVKATGNSNSLVNYNFTDAQETNGVVYYRLKQVDVDGKFEYSSVVSITNKLNNEVIIVNNPIQKGNKLQVISKTPYKIFNLIGQEVKDLNTLQAGTYVIKNKTGNTAKLVVQ